MTKSLNLRLVLVSHALLETEHLRNTEALVRVGGLNVLAIVPRRGQVTLFKGVRAVSRGGVRSLASVQWNGHLLFWPPAFGIQDFAPDIIHVDYPPWSTAFWQAALAASLIRPKPALVCTIKKNTYRRYPGIFGRLKAKLANLGFRRVTAIEFSSERARQTILKQFPAAQHLPTTVLTHQGVDVTRYAPRAAATTAQRLPTVGYAGRLDIRYKALDMLIRAVEDCRKRLGQDIQLALVGGGPDAAELRRQAQTKGWLSVYGPIPMKDVADFLRTLDVFVLPSRVTLDHEEHDAHALLQAAACGVPTIATMSGINGEIVAKGVGLLVPADDTHALAQAIGGMLTKPEFARAVSERCRTAATEQFAVEIVAKTRADFYLRVMSQFR